jgi:hypothetical protein
LLSKTGVLKLQECKEICEVEEYSGLDDYENGIYQDYTIENMLLSIIVKKKREELDIELTKIIESNYSIYETTRIISTNEDFYSLIIDYENELIDKEYIYYELKDTYLRTYLDKSDIVKTQEKYENKRTDLPITNPEQRFNVGRLVFRFINVYKYCLHIDRLYLRQECRNTKVRLFLSLWNQYKIAEDGDKYLCKKKVDMFKDCLNWMTVSRMFNPKDEEFITEFESRINMDFAKRYNRKLG